MTLWKAKTTLTDCRPVINSHALQLWLFTMCQTLGYTLSIHCLKVSQLPGKGKISVLNLRMIKSWFIEGNSLAQIHSVNKSQNWVLHYYTKSTFNLSNNQSLSNFRALPFFDLVLFLYLSGRHAKESSLSQFYSSFHTSCQDLPSSTSYWFLFLSYPGLTSHTCCHLAMSFPWVSPAFPTSL